MADTYTLISSVTVGAGGAASIEFTSIPATYTDLCFVFSTRNTGTGAATTTYFDQINSATPTLSIRQLNTDGSTVYSGTSVAWTSNSTTQTANTFTSTQIYISNYTSTNNKSFSVENVQENNATANAMRMSAVLWTSSSALNQIKFTADSNWAQYSTAYLYGIKNS